MPWFMTSIEKGAFEVINPYNNTVSRVAARPEQVHSIVFWSKNFGPFIESGYGFKLQQMGYGLFFNFTINSTQEALEPNLPPLELRLEQLAELSRSFGPDCINWRFDPICFFETAAGRMDDNLSQFSKIAAGAANAGVKSCTTSVVDHYRKVVRRFRDRSGLRLVDPPLHRKIATITRMAGDLDAIGLTLQLCCETTLLNAMPADSPVRASACISAARLANLYGPDISMARDNGQRTAAGCRCTVSRDIGSYRLHPCHHNCLFCYANPTMDRPTPTEAAPRENNSA
jgi:hypothetical protein